MTTEVLYADGSRSEANAGGTIHEGGLAIERLRLLTAKSALSLYIKTEGRMEMTRGGAKLSIDNVIAPITGKKYKRSMAGKEEALADCIFLLGEIERTAVIVDSDD